MGDFYFAIQIVEFDICNKLSRDDSIEFGLYSEDSDDGEKRISGQLSKQNLRKSVLAVTFDDDEDGVEVSLSMYIGREGKFKRCAVLCFKSFYFTQNLCYNAGSPDIKIPPNCLQNVMSSLHLQQLPHSVFLIVAFLQRHSSGAGNFHDAD